MGSNEQVYLNGHFIPLADAKISVLDRGFLFGDGVYEVIPVYHGKLFRLNDHLQRLDNSLAGIRLANPHSAQGWLDIFTHLINPDKNQYIYLQITRGIAPKRDHAFPDPTKPTVFVMCSDIVPFAGATGIKAITLDDNRWGGCQIKAITLLANILHRQSALDQNCSEAILVKNGLVTEGAASNVFAVIHNVLLTPPKSTSILPGITRGVIIELAHQHHIHCLEENIHIEELKAAHEIWLTSSTREIVPVIELDGQPIGNQKPWPVWQTINSLFQAYKANLP